MGVAIHYRGQLDDLSRIEDFEDRVLDLAIALGGTARVWRSTASGNPRRMMRGVILNLAPGQESTSLVISPEGWITNLFEIEQAEDQQFSEPQWCFVKTQFGSLESHVALVETFRSLRREFLSSLEVRDEGGYWETGDAVALATNLRSLETDSGSRPAGRPAHGLNREAAEDPQIVARRIERVAALVRRTLGRPSEHPPAGLTEPPGDELDSAAIEARWEEIERFRRRTQERLQRTIQERLARGEGIDEAVRGALQDAGLPEPIRVSPYSPDEDENSGSDLWKSGDDSEEYDSEQPPEFATEIELEVDDNDLDDLDPGDHDSEGDSHPPHSIIGQLLIAGRGAFQGGHRIPRLLKQATDVSLKGHRTMNSLRQLGLADGLENASDTFLQGLNDLCGGLIQAMINLPRTALDIVSEDSDGDDDDFGDDKSEQDLYGAGDFAGRENREHAEDFSDEEKLTPEVRGLAIVQYKRALRGAAFAIGALAQFRDPPGFAETPISELSSALHSLNENLFDQLASLRSGESDATAQDN